MSKIGWVYGVLKKNNVETDDMSPEEAFEELRELERTQYSEGKKVKSINLPKKEYAELCSAIRTKFANKIPQRGGMLYKDSYYVYNYSKKQEQILCRVKLDIENDSQLIDAIMEEYEDD